MSELAAHVWVCVQSSTGVRGERSLTNEVVLPGSVSGDAI